MRIGISDPGCPDEDEAEDVDMLGLDAIRGYTDDDLDTVFAPELPGLDRQAIRDWYNGYNWRGESSVNDPLPPSQPE